MRLMRITCNTKTSSFLVFCAEAGRNERCDVTPRGLRLTTVLTVHRAACVFFMSEDLTLQGFYTGDTTYARMLKVFSVYFDICAHNDISVSDQPSVHTYAGLCTNTFVYQHQNLCVARFVDV